MSGSPGWTTNQWVNYELYNATAGTNSYILSNTSNTITYLWDDSYGGNMSFATGNSYGIYKVLIALDQPGRGKGDLITGDTPVNSTTGTVAWTNEALEPIYAWNNTIHGNPSSTYLYSGYPTLQENRDYYNNRAMPGYTAYVYPHPLVSGGLPTPTPSPLHRLGRRGISWLCHVIRARLSEASIATSGWTCIFAAGMDSRAMF